MVFELCAFCMSFASLTAVTRRTCAFVALSIAAWAMDMLRLVTPETSVSMWASVLVVLVGVMVAKFADGVRVAVTGASEEGVFRWTEAEAALSANFRVDALADLSLGGDDMISDLHGSGDYRAHLVKVMTGRAVTAAA